MKSIGSKVPEDSFEKLRWLAYTRRTTVSAIVAAYVEKALAQEDLTSYQPLEGEGNGNS